MSLTVAHQHLKQLPTELRASVLANARSRVAFRPADDDLKALAAVLGFCTRGPGGPWRLPSLWPAGARRGANPGVRGRHPSAAADQQ